MPALDGPGPFDGDAVHNYADEATLPPAAFREAVARAFHHVCEGGAARRVPAAFMAIVGLDARPFYVDADEAVWAWACAEIVATAIGHQAETPIPAQFLRAARVLPKPLDLVPDAIRTLEIVSDPKRSELARLLKEANDQATLTRIERLREVLSIR